MGKLVLYELHGSKGVAEAKNFSPYVWRVKLALAFYNVPYEVAPLLSHEIKSVLAVEMGNPKVTVPTIKLEDGTYMVDSWAISTWLEKQYATAEKSLFGVGGEGRAFARFVEPYMRTHMPMDMKLLVMALERSIMDPISAELKSKQFGAARLDAVMELTDGPALDKLCANVRAIMVVFETHLKLMRQDYPSAEHIYLAGGRVGYADFILWGHYNITGLLPALQEGLWRHAEVPELNKWVEAMYATGLVDKAQML